jgi:hypothetical protein
MLRSYTDPVVPNHEHPFAVAAFCRNMHDRRYAVFVVLQSISDQVLKQLDKPSSVSSYRRERYVGYCRSRLCNARL